MVTVGTQSMREESRAAFWGPWWVAGWVGARDGMLAEGEALVQGWLEVMVHLDRSFSRWLWTSGWEDEATVLPEQQPARAESVS